MANDNDNVQIVSWQPSGDTYVVRFSPDGRTVLEAAGPLHYREHTIALRDGFNSDPDLVDDLNADDGPEATLFIIEPWSEDNE